MTTIKLNNNVNVYLSKSENNEEQILFKISDARNRFFEQSYDFENFQDLFEENINIEEFFDYMEKNHPQVIESQEENEILLKIIAKKSMTIVLKECNKNNNTIKFKDFEGIKKETPKNNVDSNNELENFEPLSREIGNNEYLKLNRSNMRYNHINIIYLNKKDNRIFKANYEFEDFKDFYKGLLENNPTTEKGDNKKEIKLKIIYENKNLSIILKEVILINEDEFKNLKEKYYEKMKNIKEKYEKLYNKNKELKEKIEKEKIKNDEIVRIYLENRFKYEEALKKNNEIQKLSLKI